MKRTLHEQLIERFLSGRMTGAEEEEFFTQVAIDSNLRQTFKAYRVVEDALRKHRDTIQSQHDQSRMRLASMLNLPPATAATRIPGGIAADTGGASVGSRLAIQWFLAGLVCASLLTTAIFLLPRSDGPEQRPLQRDAQIAQARAPVPATNGMEEPAHSSGRAAQSAIVEDAEMPKQVVHEKSHAQSVQEDLSSRSRSVRRELSTVSIRSRETQLATSPKATVINSPRLVKSTNEPPEIQPRHEQASTPRVAAKDTIKIRVKIGAPRE